MAHVLFYEYVENMLELRGPHRPAHLERINEWRDQGKIVLAGALGSPPHGAAIVFDVEDPAEVEQFAAEDPYVLAELVTERRIEPIALV
ncbi:MAG TPA: YciI family protein [Thermoleophilaceae bacterium]|jgi:hypothetical protein